MDLPDHCVRPLDQVVEFYSRQRARNLTVDADGVRFSRGSLWAYFFFPNERYQKQNVFIRVTTGHHGQSLICEYRLFVLILNLHLPPHYLQREVQELEAFMAAPERGAGGMTSGSENIRREPDSIRHAAVNLSFKTAYRVYRVVSRLWNWTQRRFTRAGWMVLVSLFVTAIMSMDTENMVAYQGFSLLLVLLLMAFVFSRFFRMKFSVVRLLPRFGTVGRPFTYRALVRNFTAKTQSDLTLLEDLVDPRSSFPEWLSAQLAVEKTMRSLRLSQPQRFNPFKLATLKDALIPPIPPHQEVEVQIEVTPLRRGILRFKGVTLARTDPFGLFRALAGIPAPQTTLILPRRYPLPPIALPGVMKYQEGGVALASNVGQSEEFVALRDYRRGDPLRHIHWRSWAKTGKPIVKEFEDEFFVRHALVLDTFSDQPLGEAFEEAVSVAASFACTLLTQESLLDLLFVGAKAYCFTAGRGLAHADQMLEILASVQVCSEKPFRTLENLVLNHAGVVSGCICVLLAWDEPRRNFVKKLKAVGIPVLVAIVVPPASGQPLDPGPMRDEPERFHVLEAGRIEEQLAGWK